MLISRAFALAVAIAILIGTPGSPAELEAAGGAEITVFATGLNDPRGLAFGPNGSLYVAEAGTGGTASTEGVCDQVQFPIGPYHGGNTARVLKFSRRGGVTVIADGLPSTEANPAIGGDKSGVSSLAFVGNRLLALISGGGCSHGHLEADNGILRLDKNLDKNGGYSELANLSSWLKANPGAKGKQPGGDYEPDGTWYSMLFEQGRLYAVEPNHGLLVDVHPKRGTVTLVRDLFATFGDHTYTALAADRGDLYVGTLGQIVFLPDVFPPVPDLAASFEAGVYRLSRNGQAVQVAAGLRAVLGLAFDKQHRLYALQSPIFMPGTGSLVRQRRSGEWETVVSNLTFPSSVAIGPDGAFYITECGYHCGPGDGRILRVALRSGRRSHHARDDS